MKISLIQMNMALGKPEENFRKAEELIQNAAGKGADVLVLPETWNTGFFPENDIDTLADRDGAAVKERIGALAKKYNVNIVAGSVTNKKNSGIYNTSYVFDRNGTAVAEYDKTHLFTPMGEDNYYRCGDHVSLFSLDGIQCAVIICYDVRFPELIRTCTVKGVDVMFMVAQWPAVRVPHLLALCRARAIENQMFFLCCNSCGVAGKTQYGGNSCAFDPWGEEIAHAGESEQIITADCDTGIVTDIRNRINVFRDRRPELYNVK